MAKKPAYTKTSQRHQPKPTVATLGNESANRWEDAGWLRYAMVVLLVTALCYLPSLKNQFVNWDDNPNISNNPNLERVGKGASWRETLDDIFSIERGAVIGNYNPLPILTFAIEKAVSKGEHNPWLIHFDNLLLHLLTVFFVMRLLLHLGIGRLGALAGGMLFGIHPMRVESVAWATERKDVLFAVFFFAALVLYVRWVKTGDKGRRFWLYLGMLVLAVLSLFAKVQAVALPLSMLVIDYWLRRPLDWKLLLEKTPFWILSFIFGMINICTLGSAWAIKLFKTLHVVSADYLPPKVSFDDSSLTNYDMLDRLCIGTYSFCVYIFKLFIPYPMSPLYPYPLRLPWDVYAAPLLFFAIGGLTVWLWRRDQRAWVFGILFFFFNVGFLLQWFGAGQGFLADRYTYVPYFGFFAIAAWLVDRYAAQERRRTSLMAGIGVVGAVFALGTVQQIGIWQNGDTLWSHVIELEKSEANENSVPYTNRGQYYRDHGDFTKSIQDYSQAIAINPKTPDLYNSRGNIYFEMAMSGNFQQQADEYVQKALADYNTALGKTGADKPKQRAEVLINRGAAYSSLRKFDQALADLNEGIRIDPTNENGYLTRSLTYIDLGKYESAIVDHTEYLKYKPLDANVYYERGTLRRGLNRNQEAINDLTQALVLQPSMGLAYLERARAYAQAGDKTAARQDYERAQQFKLQLTPKDIQWMGGN